MLGRLTRENLLRDPDTGLVGEGPLPYWLDPGPPSKITRHTNRLLGRVVKHCNLGCDVI